LTDDVVEVTVERVAHGGVCVGRLDDGRVVFVRHALPGERVRALITEERRSYLRADALDVLDASPDRVTPPCPHAGPGRCGGCDWQHVALPTQRELKAAVVREQLRRLAGLDVDVVVEPLPDVSAAEGPGLGWRTRVGFAVRRDGRAGLHRHRSHEIEPVTDCLIAHPLVRAREVLSKRWPASDRVDVTAAVGSGERMVAVTPRRGHRPRHDRPLVTHRVGGRSWQVTGSGFWQVHPSAADVLVDAVLGALQPEPGDVVLDLYAGAGLFAGSLAAPIGHDGRVVAVESDAKAARDAELNLADLPNVSVVRGRVADIITTQQAADLVVLDPPRTGAGPDVMRRLTALGPRRVAYVSCEPATLARDLATAAEAGLVVSQVRAFDMFPMTAHVECLATLVPNGSP
jgi:tRNA/tmRNA/rRNA uracil-C5-methylase (TrmA/RlmC/RlmD family)